MLIHFLRGIPVIFSGQWTVYRCMQVLKAYFSEKLLELADQWITLMNLVEKLLDLGNYFVIWVIEGSEFNIQEGLKFNVQALE